MENKQLKYCHPHWLATHGDALDHILKHVRQPEFVADDHILGMLDYAYRVRVSRLLRNHASLDAFNVLNRHLLQMTRPMFESKIRRRYMVRWKAFSDLLEDRISVLMTPLPLRIKDDDRAMAMLKFICDNGPVTMAQIIEAFTEQYMLGSILRRLKQLSGWEMIITIRGNTYIKGPRADEEFGQDY